MCKNKIYSRVDVLSLDFKTIKNYIHSEHRTEFIITVDGIDIPRCDLSIIPWLMIFSLPYKIPLIANKIGKSIFKQNRKEFQLNDPHIKHSRFHVDYHRLHDPALKQYFNSPPVRKRLEKLGLVTQDNYALSSMREFTEYIRYLERMRAIEVSAKIKNLYLNHNKQTEKIKKEKQQQCRQNKRKKEEKFNATKKNMRRKQHT